MGGRPLAAPAAASAWVVPAARGAAVPGASSWGRAIEVPGLGALNKRGNADVNQVSCTSAGNCAAGGYYTDGRRHQQGFVAVKRHGVWGRAIEVPGLGALNKGGNADAVSVACALAGNCAAGGSYTDGARNQQGFVAVEKNGRWGRAIEVPGLAALNKGGDAAVSSVSCGSPGNNCAAVGDYTDSGENSQGFVAVEKNGVWGKAIEPPGLAALNGDSGGGNAEVDSVSCASAGNCAAVGTYGEPYGTGFVAIEKNGIWGRATDLGLTGRIAGANAVSCASPGNCAAGGFYSDDIGAIDQGWVAIERHGRWLNEIEVPGLGALNKGGSAGVGSVSCPPAGGCAAGGEYADSHGHQQGFVISAR